MLTTLMTTRFRTTPLLEGPIILRPIRWSSIVLLVGLVSTGGMLRASDIDFEIATPPGAAPATSHQWLETLKSLQPKGIQIKVGRGNEQPEFEKLATGGYRVRGVITRRNELKLPGGTFSVHDRARLKTWAEELDERATADSQPNLDKLGLTAEQLAKLRKELSTPVAMATAGRSMSDVVTDICKSLSPGVIPQVPRFPQVDQSLVVQDELRGLACGTALAAVLRPAGLVLTPRHDDKLGTHCQIVDVASAREHWPIGVAYEGNPQAIVPKLLERLEVDIEPLPVGEVVAALQERLRLPIVWDYNGMAREEIDPAFDEVSHPPANALYAQTLRRILYKAKLKYELRTDDAGKPFLWITPMKTGLRQ